MAMVPNISSELLREPNLLVPGKRPTGSFKLDVTHPLAPNLVCAVPTPHRQAELITGVLPTMSGQAFISHRGIETPDTAWGDIFSYEYPITLKRTTHTVMTGFVNTAAKLGFSTRMWDFVGDDQRNYLQDNGAADTGRWGHMHTNTVQTHSASYWNDGLFHIATLAVTSVSATQCTLGCYIDDELLSSGGVFPSTLYDKTAVRIRCGDVADSSMVGYTTFFYAWDWTLTPAMINDLRHDPYQFLIPE